MPTPSICNLIGRQILSAAQRGVIVGLALGAVAPLGAAESMAGLRHQAAARPRPIIFNNDGDDLVYYTKAPTVEEFLRSRTEALAGSQVSTISYCTWSSGFGLFTHPTKVGQNFTTREGVFSQNVTQAFLDAGIDPLKVMIEFGRKHNIEVFWSMRMNDVHDSQTNYEWGPIMFRANRFKAAHPEALFGTAESPPKIGGWSGVDYGQPVVREHAYRIIEEVCQNYDLDGLELDFNRFPVLFKSNAMGLPATDADRAAMTDLMRRVRSAADAAGERRGRPLLIALRIPDSVDYDRAIGVDLEKWLQEDLLDLMIVGGYFQLNPWKYSVDLGRKYGVKVYSSIDDARIRRLPAARQLRNTLLRKRGVAMNLWAAGIDGIYMFNAFDPKDPLWRELGDPRALAKVDKDYFGSVQGVGYAAVSWLPNAAFQNVTSLNPDAPLPLVPGQTTAVTFDVGDDFAKVAALPKVKLRVQFKNLPENSTGKYVAVALNGTPVVNGQMDVAQWLDYEKWIEYEVDPKLVRLGANTVSVRLDPAAPPDSLWYDLHLTVRFPANQEGVR